MSRVLSDVSISSSLNQDSGYIRYFRCYYWHRTDPWSWHPSPRVTWSLLQRLSDKCWSNIGDVSLWSSVSPMPAMTQWSLVPVIRSPRARVLGWWWYLVSDVWCWDSRHNHNEHPAQPSQAESKVQCFQEYRGILEFHDLVHLGF